MYRRRQDSNTWHWRPTCSSWPTRDFESTPTLPYYGELCCECRSKEEGGCEPRPPTELKAT